MIPFRERNPVVIGALGLVVIAASILMAFRAGDLPLIGGGDTYYAEFSEAGGLKVNDEVRIAGVRVGKVDDIGLKDGRVRVAFKIDEGAEFGPQTRASIRIKTLLGAMFLALEPSGSGNLDEGATIPVDRTDSPYDVVEAFEGLGETSGKIDDGKLGEALKTMTALSRDTPDEFRQALNGVSRLSRNLASRDREINTLLRNLKKVSGVLGDRSDDIVTLMKDSSVLFKALVQRRNSIHRLLTSTSTMSTELTALVRQSRKDLKPALRHLDRVVRMLNNNQDNLDESLRLMAPFYRVFANTLGSGPWFDTYIKNLPPLPRLTP